MSAQDTGGPQAKEPAAPPVTLPVDLRDYFAAKAIVGLMAMVSGAMQTIEGDDHLAMLAYGVADAMLKERAK